MKLKKVLALLCCIALLTVGLAGCCCVTPGALTGMLTSDVLSSEIFDPDPDEVLVDYLKDHGERDGDVYFLSTRDTGDQGTHWTYFIVYDTDTEELRFEFYSQESSHYYSPSSALYLADSYAVLPVNYGENTTEITYIYRMSTGNTYTTTGKMYKDSFSRSNYTMYNTNCTGAYESVCDVLEESVGIVAASTLQGAETILRNADCDVNLYDLGYTAF